MASQSIEPSNRLGLRTSTVAAISRLYPFRFGYGTALRLVDRLAGPSSGNTWIRVDGGKALVPVEDLVGRIAYFFGDFDPRVSWVIDQSVDSGDIVLDVGANLGLVSLRLAARVGPLGHVHAFEPNPIMQGYLATTLAQNPGLPITIHPIALGTENEVLTLSVAAGNAGSATLLDRKDQSFSAIAEVPVRPLSDYAKEIGLDRIDFVKIDVEGFEAKVLAGASTVFAELAPKIVLFEEHSSLHLERLPRSIATLIGLGYQIFGLPHRVGRPKLVRLSRLASARVTDYVAISRGATESLRRRLDIECD